MSQFPMCLNGSGEPTGRVRRRRPRSDRARADIRAGLLQLSQAVLIVQADVANRVGIQDFAALDLSARTGGCEQVPGTLKSAASAKSEGIEEAMKELRKAQLSPDTWNIW